MSSAKILSTQKAKRVMVKQHGYLPQVWLKRRSYWQKMEVFGFPCQAVSMLKLQKALHGVLQRRKTDPHSPKKKIAVSSLTGFLFCEPFVLWTPWNVCEVKRLAINNTFEERISVYHQQSKGHTQIGVIRML
jgi:hypothetical protein